MTSPRKEHDHAMRGHRQNRRAVPVNGDRANGNEHSNTPT